jgi:ubiquinone/menaquinone biosynthesis C-methylase UbiE
MKYQIITNYLDNGPVVDVGIGTGIGLASLVKQGLVVGVDGSIEMLRVAKRSVDTDEKYDTRVSLICASATDLPFRSNIFPAVVCITVLQNLTDVERGVEELIRICKHGGLLGVTVLKPRSPRGLSLDRLSELVEENTNQLALLTDLAGEDAGLILRRR